MPSSIRRRPARLVPAVAATVLTGGALAGCGSGGDPSPQAARLAPDVAIGRAAGCAVQALEPTPTKATLGWPQMAEAARYGCPGTSGANASAVILARFADPGTLRANLLAEPNSRPVCLAGNDVFIDALQNDGFDGLCRNVGGTLIDGVSGLPALKATSVRPSKLARLQKERNQRVQGRALQQHWAQAG